MSDPEVTVSPDDRPLFRGEPASNRSGVRWALLLAVVVALAAGGYYAWKLRQPTPLPPVVATPTAPAAQPAEPRVEHPVTATPARSPLPALGESDAEFGAALAALFGAPAFQQMFVPDSLVRHIVVTVDNLPRRQVASRMLPLKPVTGTANGALRTAGDGSALSIAPANAARYTPYVRALEAVDSRKLAATYAQFYPLFQQSYAEQGYPNRYFNDRVFEVIDHLLATPDIKGPIALAQPKVLYEYADPALEELSAGQKAMLRMGPENEARVKAKLREIRKALQAG